CNLNALSPLCHYGMWILNLKIQDSYPQTYEVAKEIFLFSSSSSLRAIVSKNPYFGSTYDIKSDGTRSDSRTAAPRFNSNGTVYLVFNAAPPNAATKVNYSSVTANTFKLQFSEYSNFPTGNYGTNSSVPAAKRGLPKVVTTADFMLSNNGNGLFTAEIALDSAGITSVRRAAWDKYFRIVMTVRDTANVTASITTRAHEIDNTNSQTPGYVDLHSPFINPAGPSKDYLTPVYAALKALSTQVYIKGRNFMELARKPVFTENLTARSMFGKTASSMAFGFKDAEMRDDISLLSTPQGREVYFNNRVNNAFTNYACDYTLQKSLEKKASSKHGSGCCTKNRSVPAKNAPPVKAGDGLADRAFRSLFMPSEAIAAAYGGKYAVVHKIRDWIIGGGYMFTMCYATETIDRTLACSSSGNLVGYDFTFGFKDFDPTKDSPSSAGAIDANDGTMTLADQSATNDRYKRPLAVTQNHVTSFPGFTGSTTAFKKAFVKQFTGPKNSPVNILAQVSETVVKYIGAEYGDGWFSFLGGHDPRLIATYRLILDNIMIGSLSSNNPPTATSVSYGIIDWDNTDDGFEGDETDYKNTMQFGHAQ
ncbi:MAG TPA: hypothetical protein PKW98_16960, partial [Candidatus Wallbacteria bacterium]|nr:hypothetical protein [Candidatus Wallbacteria bacterium]